MMCERELRIKTTQKEEEAGMLLRTNTLQTSERLALEYKIADTYTTHT